MNGFFQAASKLARRYQSPIYGALAFAQIAGQTVPAFAANNHAKLNNAVVPAPIEQIQPLVAPSSQEVLESNKELQRFLSAETGMALDADGVLGRQTNLVRQTYLNTLGLYNGALDGNYNAATQAAFYKWLGIPAPAPDKLSSLTCLPGLPLNEANMNLTSPFGGERNHEGNDFGAPFGAIFCAAYDGYVVHAGPMEGYGNVVIIAHDGFQSYYAHASGVLAKVGDRVEAGDHIGAVGNTGRSTGPHLHLGYLRTNQKGILLRVANKGVDGYFVDPLPYWQDALNTGRTMRAKQKQIQVAAEVRRIGAIRGRIADQQLKKYSIAFADGVTTTINPIINDIITDFKHSHQVYLERAAEYRAKAAREAIDQIKQSTIFLKEQSAISIKNWRANWQAQVQTAERHRNIANGLGVGASVLSALLLAGAYFGFRRSRNSSKPIRQKRIRVAAAPKVRRPFNWAPSPITVSAFLAAVTIFTAKNRGMDTLVSGMVMGATAAATNNSQSNPVTGNKFGTQKENVWNPTEPVKKADFLKPAVCFGFD